jgi:hypothetical protein
MSKSLLCSLPLPFSTVIVVLQETITPTGDDETLMLFGYIRAGFDAVP